MFLADHAHVLLFYAITPMHAGAGSSTGAVDLPIQRERHTQRPIVQSSGVKGALRDACEQAIIHKQSKEKLDSMPEANEETRREIHDKARAEVSKSPELNAVFGREGQDTAQAGALSTSDAKVLFFPVRSSHAPFLYVTCPSVLRQFVRDAKAVGLSGVDALKNVTVEDKEGYGLDPALYTGSEATGGVVLEDMRVTLQAPTAEVEQAQQVLEKLVKFEDVALLQNAVVLSDADFLYLVETTCPIQTRIVLGPNGTTSEKGGNLWYQELLPADTLLYSLSFLSAERKAQDGLPASQLADWLKTTLPKHLQLGGDATLGRGFCELQWIAKGAQ